MAVQLKTIQAEDLLRMPDDGFRYELVRGELRKMTPAGHEHGQITARLTWRLAQYVETNNLGVVYAAETGFLLSSDPDTVRAPDVAFVRAERVEAAGDVEGYFPGAPDLAVEVISPGDSYTDVEEKVFDWLEAGTQMAVVVNPRQRTVTVYRSLSDIVVLTENDSFSGGDVVPGWTLAARELFA
ncbi:MAG: Uma2 family endonuclease [Anaerolineae bacterium]